MEELSGTTELVDSTLKEMVKDAALLIKDTASTNESDFEDVLERLNPRSLGALKKFFVTLESANATVRIVEDNDDFTLDLSSVHRGKIRVDNADIKEDPVFITAILRGFMPDRKTFEAILFENGEHISGTVAKDAAEQYEAFVRFGSPPIEKVWKLEVMERIVKPIMGDPKKTYRLLKFLTP